MIIVMRANYLIFVATNMNINFGSAIRFCSSGPARRRDLCLNIPECTLAFRPLRKLVVNVDALIVTDRCEGLQDILELPFVSVTDVHSSIDLAMNVSEQIASLLLGLCLTYQETRANFCIEDVIVLLAKCSLESLLEPKVVSIDNLELLGIVLLSLKFLSLGSCGPHFPCLSFMVEA